MITTFCIDKHGRMFSETRSTHEGRDSKGKFMTGHRMTDVEPEDYPDHVRSYRRKWMRERRAS